MNIQLQLKTKLLIYLLRENLSLGFTLLELMVVMIFLSIFAALSLPNLIRQAGKAREVEFKNVIGTINRAQQTYHWEKGVFAQGATDAESTNLLNVTFDVSYIDTFNIRAYPEYATIAPTNDNYELDQTRAYSGGTYHSQGNYRVLICQSYEVTNAISAPLALGDCAVDAQRLQ